MKRILRAFAALALILVAGACTDDPVGIFASLGRETELSDGTKEFRKASPSFVAEVGGYYYAGVGGLWRRPVSGGAWSKVSSPGGAGPLATSGVKAGSDIWVLFKGADGSNPQLRSTDDGSLWASPALPALAAGEYADSIMAAGAQVFLSTHSTDTVPDPDVTHGKLYYWNGAAFVNALGVADFSGAAFTSVANNGATYYAGVGSNIFSGSLPGMTVMASPGIGDIGGLAMVAAALVTSGSSGKLATPTWTLSPDIDSDARRLTDIVVVATANDGGSGAVLVGSKSWGETEAAGYFEFDLDTFSVASASPNGDYDLVADETNFATSLAGTSISKFFYDSANGRLFALTTGAGLWSNEWNGSSWSGWDRE